MINIDNKIRISSHGLDFFIEKKQKITDHFLAQKENIGTDRWNIQGYYSSLPWLCKELIEKYDLDENMISRLTQIKEKIEEAIESFIKYNIDSESQSYYKIIIDEDWSAVGKKMHFIVTQRSTIIEHRFTKQENVGKDKFTTYGHLPQVNLILKAVLNEKIINLASSSEEFDIDDIDVTVDYFIENLENLTIKELNEGEYIEENDEDIDEDIDEIIEENNVI